MEVKKTHRFLNITDPYVECGDLAKEIGKHYMTDLMKAIEEGSKFNREKLWFICVFKKNPFQKEKMHLKIGISDFPIKKMRESMDLWEYNYKTNELTAIWSLPHRFEMKNYLRTPELYDKKLIHWINQYLKQENIDIKTIIGNRLII